MKKEALLLIFFTATQAMAQTSYTVIDNKVYQFDMRNPSVTQPTDISIGQYQNWLQQQEPRTNYNYRGNNNYNNYNGSIPGYQEIPRHPSLPTFIGDNPPPTLKKINPIGGLPTYPR